MTTEQRTIPVVAYRDPDGHPTCSIGPDAEQTCMFIAARKFGMVQVCGITLEDIPRQPPDLKRGEFVAEPWEHYLRPVDKCPVWAEGEP